MNTIISLEKKKNNPERRIAMDARKFFPFFRKAMLSALSFWGYFVIRIFATAFVTALYTDSDTAFEGFPPSYGIVCALVSAVVLALFSFDSYVCDPVYCLNYLDETDPESEKFELGHEFKELLHTPSFYVGIGIWAFFSLITLGFAEMSVCVAVNVFAELLARRRWFSERNRKGLVKKPKRPYAVSLFAHILLWLLIASGAILCVGMLKMSLGSIAGLVAYALSFAVCVAVSVLAFLFFYRRIRAIRIQKRLMKKISAVCRANGIRFREPKNIYSAALLQKVSSFTLEHRHIRFNCILIPTLLRKTPLYFLGNGTVKRVHTFYFFRIELFKREKIIEYKFNKTGSDEKNIILLSPIPRAFYLGPVGNPTDGDNSSEIDNALIYSGSAFCNYVERTVSQKKFTGEI